MAVSHQSIGALSADGERRRSLRRSFLDSYMETATLGDNGGALILDVSEDGLGLQAVSILTVGASTPFRFSLPHGGTVEGTGRVAWTDATGRAGLRLVSFAGGAKAALTRWISSPEPTVVQTVEAPVRDAVTEAREHLAAQTLDTPAALAYLVQQAAQETGAHGAALALRDGAAMVCRASVGAAPAVGVRLQGGSGLTGECARTASVVRCEDTEVDPRADRLLCRRVNLRSTLIVPVMFGGEVVGVLETLSSRPRAFDEDHVRCLRGLAELVAAKVRAEFPAVTAEVKPVIVKPEAPSVPPQRKAVLPKPEAETKPTAADEILELEPLPVTTPRFFNELPPIVPPPAKPVAKPAVATAAAAAAPALAPELLEPLPQAVETVRAATVPVAPVPPRPASTPKPAPPRVQSRIEEGLYEASAAVTAKPAALPVRPRRVPRGAMLAIAAGALALAGGGIYLEFRPPVVDSLAVQAATAHTAPPAAATPAAATPAVTPVDLKVAPAPAAVKPAAPRATSPAKPSEKSPAEDMALREPSEVVVRRAPVASVAPPSLPSSNATAPSLPGVPSVIPDVPVSKGISEAKLIHRVDPVYPQVARALHIEGSVEIRGLLTRDGQIKNPVAISGPAALRGAALAAVRKWRYEPSRLDGQPTERDLLITISFHLPK